MNWIDPALLESLEKDYFNDVRVMALVNCFRSAQSQVVNISEKLSATIEEWKQHKGELFISLATPIIQPEIKDDKPFGYFRAEPFGWTDCAPTDEGAIPLYERPKQSPTPPEAQTEAEKVAYCAGWWAALEAERKELLRIAEEQK